MSLGAFCNIGCWLLVVLSLAVAPCCLVRRAPELREMVWKGEVRIKGVETVPRGMTLVIQPGTRVVFVFQDDDGDGWGDSGIWVRGSIWAVGTESRPIRFETEGKDRSSGRWGEIRIESAGASLFAHCRFRGGQWAIHSHHTPFRVESSRFTNNVGGVKFRGGPVGIYGSNFTENGTAIRYWESDPEIISNLVQGNGTGIFCREGSQRSLIRGNNFFHSADYHIKLGELQDVDVDARYNFWGSIEVEEIEKKLYHKEDVSYLGRVLYDPLVSSPFPLEEIWKRREARTDGD